MRFTVLPVGRRVIPTEPGAYLIDDNWDDYTYKTMFWLHIVDNQDKHDIGAVKVATRGMPERSRTFLPATFNQLSQEYYSVGSDVSYYEKLRTLGENVSNEVLQALRDVAYNKNLLQSVRDQPAFTTSLLRSTQIRTVEEQYFRIAHGGAVNTPYEFRYIGPRGTLDHPAVLDFSVEPRSYPPTNIHALIGSNGVGKTHLLGRLGRAVVDTTATSDGVGTIVDHSNTTIHPFANVVALGFSAFDPFDPIRQATGTPITTLVCMNPTERMIHHACARTRDSDRSFRARFTASTMPLATVGG